MLTGKLESKEAPNPGVNVLASSNSEVLLKKIVWRKSICSGAAAKALAMLLHALVFRYFASPSIIMTPALVIACSAVDP